jgi:hypothetical protein
VRGMVFGVGAGVLAAGLLVTGCEGQQGATKPEGGGQMAGKPMPRPVADRIPLGDTALAPKARGMTVLVVGDSWARYLGNGLTRADRRHRNTVVNAGEAGCGLMRPEQIRIRGRMAAAPKRCNAWPQRWKGLVAKYRPAAVVLEVGFWDSLASQRLPGDRKVRSIIDPAFQKRFDRQLDRAIRVLGARGAPVFVPNVIDNSGAARANSDAMNGAVREAVRRNRQARLLDVRGQLCAPTKRCPVKVGNVQVYDRTGHPSAPAQARLGAWILNTVHADLRKNPRSASGAHRGAQRADHRGAQRGPKSAAPSREGSGSPSGAGSKAPARNPAGSPSKSSSDRSG